MRASVELFADAIIVAGAEVDVSPVTIRGAPEKFSNDDGGNIWVDGVAIGTPLAKAALYSPLPRIRYEIPGSCLPTSRITKWLRKTTGRLRR